MLAVLLDIDNTLIDTDRRRWRAWCHVLARELPFEIIKGHRSLEILKKFAYSNPEIWKRFWRLLLCWDDEGVELLNLDTPFPYASSVVKRWSKELKVVYFTGRSKNMHDHTLKELDKFGFPTENTDLTMLSLQDWKMYLNAKISSIHLRSNLFSKVRVKHEIARVVDDIPRYFSIYKQVGVPERIGIKRSNVYSKREYFLCGATKVITSWKELGDTKTKH